MAEKKGFNKYAYDNDYIRENYDRLSMCIPKGFKPLLKEYCREHNISMNAWISDYIFKTLKEAGKLDEPKDNETRDETDK